MKAKSNHIFIKKQQKFICGLPLSPSLFFFLSHIQTHTLFFVVLVCLFIDFGEETEKKAN